MSDSVRRGGTVSGPAPLEKNPDVVALSSARCADTRHDAGFDNTAPPEIENGKEPELSIAVARAALSNALKSQRNLEARLEKVCSRLLIAGEQIPSLDQDDFSMLQEAYMNASIAASVATEKTLIWRARVDRLATRSRLRSHDRMTHRNPDDGYQNDDYLMAA